MDGPDGEAVECGTVDEFDAYLVVEADGKDGSVVPDKGYSVVGLAEFVTVGEEKRNLFSPGCGGIDVATPAGFGIGCGDGDIDAIIEEAQLFLSAGNRVADG